MSVVLTDQEATELAEENRRLRAQLYQHERLLDDPIMRVLSEVQAECQRQELKYGPTNRTLMSGTGPDSCWTMPLSYKSAPAVEKAFRADYERLDKLGLLTWAYLVREEIAEAFQEEPSGELSPELIQAAALIVSWVKTVRERGW